VGQGLAAPGVVVGCGGSVSGDVAVTVAVIARLPDRPGICVDRRSGSFAAVLVAVAAFSQALRCLCAVCRRRTGDVG
jgi:hypothetical protein